MPHPPGSHRLLTHQVSASGDGVERMVVWWQLPSSRLDGGRLVEWKHDFQTAGTLVVATRLRGGPPERLAPHRALWVMQTVVPRHAGDIRPGTLRSIERDLEPCLGKDGSGEEADSGVPER